MQQQPKPDEIELLSGLTAAIEKHAASTRELANAIRDASKQVHFTVEKQAFEAGFYSGALTGGTWGALGMLALLLAAWALGRGLRSKV